MAAGEEIAQGERAEAEGDPRPGLTRRVVLRDGTALTLAVMLAGPASGLGDIAVALGGRGRAFLDEREMEALRALVDRFIPGRPEDTDEGALAAGCAEAIDALLGAFGVDPPRIYAGGPFSDRAGSPVNHFERFLRLDRYEEKGWKLRIKGSRGRPGLELNGPVKGWQRIYREGLAALDAAAPGGSFAALPGPVRDTILRISDDERIAELVDVSFPHTYQFMYGAPEYGGNRELLGWRYSNYDGDVQPRGWTREEIEGPPGARAGRSTAEALKSLESVAPLGELLALAPLAAPEAAHHIAARSGESVSALRAEIEPVLEWARRGGIDGS